MGETIYDIWLKTLDGVSQQKKIELVKNLGNSKTVYQASKSILENIKGINKDISNIILENKDMNKAEKILNTMRKEDINGITFYHDSYPKSLREIYNPPFLIYMRGNLLSADESAIALVGARKATSYGKWAAHTIASKLAEYGVTVVSGMAYGVDTFAHQGALENGGRTIAVLGCGVDICYPKSNYKLMKQIIEQGAVISEYDPGTPPLPRYFPARNRIISGLSKGIVIVEAGLKSGSLITAEYALEQGRDVYAIPGNIESIYSQGTNKLIKEGAIPIISIEDFLYELNLVNSSITLDDKIELGSDERELLESVEKYQSISVDALIYKLRKQPSEVNALLTILEIKGLIKVMSGKIIIAK